MGTEKLTTTKTVKKMFKQLTKYLLVCILNDSAQQRLDNLKKNNIVPIQQRPRTN